jgi:uncharacterized protein
MRVFSIIISFILSNSLQINAQKPETKSLLWQISGKNLKHTSYLYGTMHVQDESVFHMEDLVKKHIDICDAFAMEVLLDEVNPVVMQQHLVMKNTSLKDLLTVEEYALIDTYMKEKLGQGLLMFNKMKPFFLAAQLMQLDMSKDRELHMDLDFLNYAKKQGKVVFGVEQFEDQIKAVDKISLRDQALMLVKMISDTTSGNSSMDKLKEAYINQDIELLYEITVSDTSMPANFTDAFIIHRNKAMTKTIIKTAKKQSTLYAVGAAHLGGPDGIIALLRKKGYTLNPITTTP